MRNAANKKKRVFSRLAKDYYLLLYHENYRDIFLYFCNNWFVTGVMWQKTRCCDMG